MFNLIVGIILVTVIILSTFSSKFDDVFDKLHSFFDKVDKAYMVFVIIIIVIALIIAGV